MKYKIYYNKEKIQKNMDANITQKHHLQVKLKIL
jgi:hypothetical protein